jgi:hypothetical protein
MSDQFFDVVLAQASGPDAPIRRRVTKTADLGPDGYPVFAADDGFWVEIRTEPDRFYSARNAGWPDGHRGYVLTELRRTPPHDEPDSGQSTCPTAYYSSDAVNTLSELDGSGHRSTTICIHTEIDTLQSMYPPDTPGDTEIHRRIDATTVSYAVKAHQILVKSIRLRDI